MVDQFLLQALFLLILKAVAFTTCLFSFHVIFGKISKIATAIRLLLYVFVYRNMQIIADGFHTQMMIIQN